MKVIASVAISVDGCLDDTFPDRLKLSSAEDWAEVLRLRSLCDAILVGAGTLRADNPSLVIRDQALRAERVAAGKNPDIIKVAVSASGDIDPNSNFFTEGAGGKILFLSDKADATPFKEVATVVQMDVISAKRIVAYLASRGCRTLMVEGGSKILNMFFAEDMVDRLRLAIAPITVGDACAPKFVREGIFPIGKESQIQPCSVRLLGDTTVMEYNFRTIDPDTRYLIMAIEQSRKCVPSKTAYSVGAVIVTADGDIFRGYTHETDPHNHAEEEAILKALAAGAKLSGASIYCSMEPCSQRASKPISCSSLIIQHGFARVVFAYREPDNFVVCNGMELLRNAGIEVRIMERFAWQVIEINRHILL